MMKVDFRADLHCHSFCSDGSDTPLELLKKAKEANLSGLSITDHDTIAAYTPDLAAAAGALGIELLTGVELSSELGDATVHVLGYGFDLRAPSLSAFLSEMQHRREKRNRAILQKLTERNLPISEEELQALGQQLAVKKSLGRPHIAELMVKKGYVATRQEAFERYLREGGLCYVSGFKFTPLDAIQEIKKASGKAVLAHPHYLKAGTLLRTILSLPFDGIECYYGNLPKELESRWIKLAKEKNWIATGGSDYHGTFRPYISLGSSWVSQETFLKCTTN